MDPLLTVFRGSGKIRDVATEKSGISIFYVKGQGESENDLAEVNQTMFLISRHIFVKTQLLQVQNFST